ncbi:hypothetical protein N9P55_00980 [bacterium]|nr:hypothetical protein [bacterium]MDB4088175.1 hypothetical protein [Flavobacteriales bacterium]
MELQVLHSALEAEINEDFYYKLIAQLEKDFVMSGINYDFSDLQPDQLLNALYEVIEELLSKEYPTLLNLLYRMDIPESSINFSDDITAEQHLVNLILRREFLKIKLRMKYSS